VPFRIGVRPTTMAAKARKTKTRYLIFISHSMRDQWVARQMARVIERNCGQFGVVTFLDEKDIEGGDNIHEAIRKNIKECGEFLVLLTRRSISRPWVLIEMGAAWSHHKRIVVVIDDVRPEEIPDITLPYKAVDINKFDDYVAEVKRRVRRR
jgi:hypothetical protein